MNFVLCLPPYKENAFIASLSVITVPNSLSQDESTLTEIKLNALENAILIASLIGRQRLIAF